MSGELYRDIAVLEHMVKYCESIEKSVERFGDEFEIFEKDNDFKNSVSMSILQIGELVSHFTDEFRNQNKEIPWNKIIGMRNHFAHGYAEMDEHEIWKTVKNDIEPLKNFCNDKLKFVYEYREDVSQDYKDLIDYEIDIEEEL